MDIRKTFATNLKYWMVKAGYNQLELSNAVGASDSTISTWILGKNVPRMDKVDKLCSVLNCTRSDLLEDSSARSLRDRAAAIIDRMSDEQLSAFLTLYDKQ